MRSLSRPGSSKGVEREIQPLKRAGRLGAHTPDTPGTSTTSLPTASLRAHLHHLLPKYALFHTCVQIHQIASVPLVNGEFAVKWKFKHTTNKRPAGINDSSKLFWNKGKGKEKESSSSGSGDNIPSVIVSTSETASIASSASSLPSGLPHSSSSSELSIPPSDTDTDTQSLYPCQHPPSSTPTPSRGITPFLPLQEHSITWSHTLHTMLKIPITRPQDPASPATLAPCPFKLIVTQRVIAGDPDAPRNPRLGAVYLDLAEYASVKGETTRRYLLRESKTNAILKLTISLTHVGGETDYVAPTLPKAEIMNGISGLLDSEMYRAHTDVIELFGSSAPPQFSQRNRDFVNRIGGDVSDSESEYESFDFDEREQEQEQEQERGKKLRPGALLDVNSLPSLYGPKNTEMLIDALFNPFPVPVPVVDGVLKVGDNPFAYYVPKHEETEAQDRASVHSHDSGSSTYPHSVESQQSSSMSAVFGGQHKGKLRARHVGRGGRRKEVESVVGIVN